MAKKKYQTFLIMPSTPGKKTREFSLPVTVLVMLSLLMLATVVWAGIGVWSVYHHHEINTRCRWLVKENQIAAKHLEQAKRRVVYLNQQLNELREQATFVRKFLGLEPRNEGKGKLGQGGTEITPPVIAPPADLANFETTPEPSGINLPAENLFLSAHEIEKVSSDFSRIITALEDRQKQMERTPFITPVDPKKCWISSRYGLRTSPFTGKKQLHLGIDLAGWKGTPIIAPAKGKVISIRKRRLLGRVVTIRHNSTYTTVYGHLQKAVVKKGQLVERGDVIGYIGNSGRSTGYHLHYGIKKNGKWIDPASHMMDWDKNQMLFAAGEN
jgi:murein DD-endopeptidase MepM/ murein hydrolase activator NlpD